MNDEPIDHYIEFDHVYKTFDKPVLVDVNFYLDAGKTLAIIGRSGVGKSVSLGTSWGLSNLTKAASASVIRTPPT